MNRLVKWWKERPPKAKKPFDLEAVASTIMLYILGIALLFAILANNLDFSSYL